MEGKETVNEKKNNNNNIIIKNNIKKRDKDEERHKRTRTRKETNVNSSWVYKLLLAKFAIRTLCFLASIRQLSRKQKQTEQQYKV